MTAAACSIVCMVAGFCLGLLLVPVWWPRVPAVCLFVFIQGCILILLSRLVASAGLRLRFSAAADATLPVTVWQCITPAGSWALFWLGSRRAAALAPLLGRRVDAAFVGLALSIVLIVLSYSALFARLCEASPVFTQPPANNPRTKAKVSSILTSHSRSSSMTNFLAMDQDAYA